ncbi:hypothetical protein B0J12DRAFT_284958 [Macrophomina phaseolina]|uniref:Uncharacterized protein n=1 Tax=Macrophomina phaseolina TaxID=35725 RepID=A0ABQ8GNQ2_9PEZI|nr:hypothetical protein B0J12DRAFT_284958 [Macrophomina phaseolina]
MLDGTFCRAGWDMKRGTSHGRFAAHPRATVINDDEARSCSRRSPRRSCQGQPLMPAPREMLRWLIWRSVIVRCAAGKQGAGHETLTNRHSDTGDQMAAGSTAQWRDGGPAKLLEESEFSHSCNLEHPSPAGRGKGGSEIATRRRAHGRLSKFGKERPVILSSFPRRTDLKRISKRQKNQMAGVADGHYGWRRHPYWLADDAVWILVSLDEAPSLHSPENRTILISRTCC